MCTYVHIACLLACSWLHTYTFVCGNAEISILQLHICMLSALPVYVFFFFFPYILFCIFFFFSFCLYILLPLVYACIYNNHMLFIVCRITCMCIYTLVILHI